jgi:hypothetical protein
MSWKNMIIALLALFGTIMVNLCLALELAGPPYLSFLGMDLLGWTMAGWILTWLILSSLLKENAIGKQKLCDQCGGIAKSVFCHTISLENLLMQALLLYTPAGLVFWARVRNRVKCQICRAKSDLSHGEAHTSPEITQKGNKGVRIRFCRLCQPGCARALFPSLRAK